MKVITQELMAKDAAMSWYRTYWNLPENRIPSITKKAWEKIYDELRCLENPTPEKVNRITGSDTWTSIRCDNCGLVVIAAVEFEASDWPICICHDCLISAANNLIMEITK